MRINSIASPLFGYNKEYHKKVAEYLSTRKQDKEIANILLKADNLCLSIEDEIVEMEKSPKKMSSKAYMNATDWLSDFKVATAFYMENYFPQLKYVAHINNQYNDEALYKKNENAVHWRLKICAKVSEWIPNIVRGNECKTKIDEALKEEEEKAREKKEQQQTLEDVRNQAIDDYQAKMSADILEKFIPTHSSPRGFCDVAGMDDIKNKFRTDLLDYIENPLLMELDEHEYGIRAPRGFLFYGPPGCGKTFITQALAAETQLDMYKMDVSKVGSKYVNQTSNNIQAVFEFLSKNNQKTGKQCILFMDEVDSLAINRDGDVRSSGENAKATTTLLKLIEQARDNGIILIAATNKYDLLDDAFKARFDSHIYFGLPDEKLIKQIVTSSLAQRAKGIELSEDEEKINHLVPMLKGHSNRSIVFIVDEAAKIAKNKLRKQISFEDVKEAIDKSELDKVKEEDYIKTSKQPKKHLGFA